VTIGGGGAGGGGGGGGAGVAAGAGDDGAWRSIAVTWRTTRNAAPAAIASSQITDQGMGPSPTIASCSAIRSTASLKLAGAVASQTTPTAPAGV